MSNRPEAARVGAPTPGPLPKYVRYSGKTLQYAAALLYAVGEGNVENAPASSHLPVPPAHQPVMMTYHLEDDTISVHEARHPLSMPSQVRHAVILGCVRGNCAQLLLQLIA